MKKQWLILKPKINKIINFKKKFKIENIFVRILLNKKISSKNQIKNFLNPSLKNIQITSQLNDIKIAIKRIYNALIKKEKIIIFGDYDVDGVTSTALIVSFLKYAGGNIDYHIPHRIHEGYDLQYKFIKNFAIPNKYNLIITVDCGSNSHKAIKEAKLAGIDTIVTDHHNITNISTNAIAILNPKLMQKTENLKCLAGVGVVFYLLISLRKYLRKKKYWENIKEPNLAHYCDLVALGTIGDIVPIIGNNRILTHKGLQLINKKPRIGIKELINISNLQNEKIDSESIAFHLVPKLNAAGRIQNAKIACELLLSNNKIKSKKIAKKLFKLNLKRQIVEKILLKKIKLTLHDNPKFINKNIIILEGKNWYLGVIGIVASRLVKKFYKPVIILTSENQISKGSARSLSNINITKFLSKCNYLLESFGGHPLAAGLAIKSKKISSFSKHIDTLISSNLKNSKNIITLKINAHVILEKITSIFLKKLEKFMPFGNKNESPIFIDYNIKIISCKTVGKYHHKIKLKSNSNKTYNAIIFYTNNKKIKIKTIKYFKAIAYKAKWNYWNNTKTIQIIIEDANPNEII